MNAKKVKTLPSYIIASDSWSACGRGNELHFSTTQFQTVKTAEQIDVPFFAMQDLPVDTSEKRILSSLSSVVGNAVKKAGLTAEQLANTAIILGSTSLDVSAVEAKPEQTIWLTNTDRLSGYLKQQFATSDLHLTINTACTAGTNAVILADQLLNQNKAQYVIVVGCEFYNPLTVEGFYSLDLQSSQGLRTFSESRSGLVLGEGVAALVMAKHTTSPSQLKLVGYGSGCDHYSLTMTQESGVHIQAIIEMALKKANLDAEQIDLIKVHGTATLNNDQAELNAFNQWLEHAPIFAFKPFTGHTLGACGVLELALMDYLHQQQLVIPRPKYLNTDAILRPFSDAKPLSSYQHILLNHCGFGGNNAALIVEVAS